MKLGTLYGVGVGPGDPELITVKAARILSHCKHIFVPRAKIKAGSLALAIAGQYVGKNAHVRELTFPMTTNSEELGARWEENGRVVAEVLKEGEDAAFLTLGDLFLYSTYIYLLRELQKLIPNLEVVSVPGVTSFSLAAALTNFPVGEGNGPVTIIPAAVSDNAFIREALIKPGTVVLMKVDKGLPELIDLMEEMGVIDNAVMVSHAGMEGERIETDLRQLKNAGNGAGYFSVILVHTKRGGKQ